MITAILFHVIDQLVCHGIYNDNLFLCDAGKVVIKGAAVDDILGCFRDIGGLIHQYRRVACSCSHCSLSGGKDCGHNARATGSTEHIHVFVLENVVAHIHGGLGNCGHDILRTANLNTGTVYHVNGQIGTVLCAGVRHEYDCVSSSQHADGVADDGTGRVCGGADSSDHSPGTHLGQCQASVTGPGDGLEILRARSLLSHQLMLDDLVADISHAGLFYCQLGKELGVFQCFFTDICNDFFTEFQGHRLNFLLCCLCCRDGFICGLKDTQKLLLRSLRGCRCRSCGTHALQDASNNLLDLLFVTSHNEPP